ncbi:MAG: hypothetical protein ABUT20_06985 [Bacteroidota bacterium]
MEVHAHTHTPQKKWTHYLWEFFMLFLAVFCGFLAENQREHLVEQQREKQFMRSMVEDLTSDTMEIKKILSAIDTSQANIDSMLLLFTAANVTNASVIRSYQFTFPALNNIPIVFNDRTITQLKNSGSMRLIHNQKVNDALISYWKHIEIITRTQERHSSYRIRGREMETRIFNTAEIFFKNNGRIAKPSLPVHLINSDIALIKEYANVVAYCGVMLGALYTQEKEQNELAIELIGLIKKEYHLK